MPQCKNCQSVFPNREIIDGIARNLHTRKFCLQCSPFGQRNTKDITKPSLSQNGKICPCCQQDLPLSEFYVRRGNQPTSYCKECINKIRIEKGRKLKKTAIAYKGGKCKHCGYNKYDGALEFHHIDPNQKDPGFNTRRAFHKIQEELNKCILLCSNCHREEHARIAGIWP